jgi:hypothetical protein
MKTKIFAVAVVMYATSAFAGVAFTRQVLDVIRDQSYQLFGQAQVAVGSSGCATITCPGNDVLLYCGSQAPEDYFVDKTGQTCSVCSMNHDTLSGTITITARATCLQYP